jgi:phage baseplate assembly protein W
MSTYNFKSSGKTAVKRKDEIPAFSRNPVGIKTPLKLDDKNLFAMHYDNADQVHDNLRNLLLTNWGERLGFYYFGANLRDLTSELSSIDSFDNEAIQRIRDAVSAWMPFVSLKDFSSRFDREENKNIGILKITITYNVPQLRVENRALQISLHVI